MPDVQEVFRMATNKVKPDANALERQLRRQRKSGRGRRMRTYLVIAAVLAAVAVALVALQRSMPDTEVPGIEESPPSSFTATLPVGATPVKAEIVNVSGQRTSTVEGLPLDAYALSYVPRANEIAFIASTDAGLDAVGVLDVETGEAHLVPTPESLIIGSSVTIGTVALSPDGGMVAFEAIADGNTDIYLANIDGTGLTRLTDDPADDQFPQWSPDGTTIVYDNAGNNQKPDDPQYSRTAEIYSVDATSTGTPTRLTHNSVDDNAPSFSPDGRQIAFFHGGEIWTMSNNGGDQQSVLGGNGQGGFTPRWSPNGSMIAYTNYTDSPRPMVALGTYYADQPVVLTRVVDVQSGRVTAVPNAGMATDYNVPQWVDNGHLLVLRPAR
jgi:Tol biopolymer transport system component